MAKKVLIATEKPFAEAAKNQMVEEMQNNGIEVDILENYSEKSELLEAVKDANGIIIRSDKITPEVIDAASNLELVVRAGAGYDNVDVPYAKEKGIIVENTPGQNSNAVAELALEMMLAAARPFNGKTGTELKGKKLSIHGFGHIGKRVAHFGRSAGMHVTVYDKFEIDKNVASEHGVTIVDSLEDLYKDADFVSLHIPKTKDTAGSIGYNLLKQMADDGKLINTARAEIINEEDLVRIMKEKTGFVYATDIALINKDLIDSVFNEIGTRIITTPKKQGAQTIEANLNAGLAAARQTIAFFNEGDTTFCVYKLIPSHLERYTRLAVQLARLNSAFVDNPSEIQISCYGELDKHKDPFAEYVLKGMFTDILGKEATPDQAVAYAKERDIKVVTRIPDQTKGYGNALTIDYIASDGTSHSLRGRIDEEQMEASRIGEFKARMPLDPGVYVIATYKDKPGMADVVGKPLCEKGYNRIRIGVEPNLETGKAQAYWQVDKSSMNPDDQLKEIKATIESMKEIPDVHDVKVIDLRTN